MCKYEKLLLLCKQETILQIKIQFWYTRITDLLFHSKYKKIVYFEFWLLELKHRLLLIYYFKFVICMKL